MGLFSPAQAEKISNAAARSAEALKPSGPAINVKSINSDLQAIEKQVEEYFSDSPAILITTKQELHDYVSKCIEYGYAGIDTETTGLDRIKDYIVGWSLYVPGMPEAYIPCKHLTPIFDTPRPSQLTYEECGEELQRLVDAGVHLILANADFDTAMIYKDFRVDIKDNVYYDVILAWRCIKEDEKDNTLKGLYAKYPMHGQVDPKKFSDFFPVKLFPYCRPEIAKLYAANDAKITFDLFLWQVVYITKSNPKCQKAHLEKIADLFWNVEMPMTRVCAMLHRTGMYIDNWTANKLQKRYNTVLTDMQKSIAAEVQTIIDEKDFAANRKRPFRTGADFNPNSTPQVKYLLSDLLGLDMSKGTGKEILAEYKNIKIVSMILDYRSLDTVISTFVIKLPKAVARDQRIHGSFKQIGAACVTGDTIIPTSKGYYLAKDLCAECISCPGEFVDKQIGLVNKDQNVEFSDGIIMYKDVPTVKITTEHGFVLEGTFNHPVMVSKYTSKDLNVIYNDKKLLQIWEGKQFKELSQISVGDIIELPCNYSTSSNSYQETGLVLGRIYNNRNAQAKIPEYYDEDFAEFLGMYHADGSASSREGTYTIALANDEDDVISRFKVLAEKLFNVTVTMYAKQRELHEVESYINCKRIESVDSILSHGKRNKRIPSAIWRSPISVINAYIKGMTLDSSVHIEGQTGRVEFELSIIHPDDARLVQIHLASQGILCGWGFNENKDFKSPRLKFNADNYMLFRDIIGFVESRKYVQTDPCIKNPYRRRRIEDSFRVKVKSIEFSHNDVYDFHVPESHSFISNGFISHNTGRMASENPNLQNIPSHRTDIRHLFRGTPQKVENMQCSNDAQDNIGIQLMGIDQIKTSENQWVYVKDAELNSAFLLKDENNNNVKALLLSKEPINLDFKLTFRKEN